MDVTKKGCKFSVCCNLAPCCFLCLLSPLCTSHEETIVLSFLSTETDFDFAKAFPIYKWRSSAGPSFDPRQKKMHAYNDVCRVPTHSWKCLCMGVYACVSACALNFVFSVTSNFPLPSLMPHFPCPVLLKLHPYFAFPERIRNQPKAKWHPYTMFSSFQMRALSLHLIILTILFL